MKFIQIRLTIRERGWESIAYTKTYGRSIMKMNTYHQQRREL